MVPSHSSPLSRVSCLDFGRVGWFLAELRVVVSLDQTSRAPKAYTNMLVCDNPVLHGASCIPACSPHRCSFLLEFPSRQLPEMIPALAMTGLTLSPGVSDSRAPCIGDIGVDSPLYITHHLGITFPLCSPSASSSSEMAATEVNPSVLTPHELSKMNGGGTLLSTLAPFRRCLWSVARSMVRLAMAPFSQHTYSPTHQQR